jgi:hypothetical protein
MHFDTRGTLQKAKHVYCESRWFILLAEGHGVMATQKKRSKKNLMQICGQSAGVVVLYMQRHMNYTNPAKLVS